MVAEETAQRFFDSSLLPDVELRLRKAILAVLEEQRAKSGAVLLEQGQLNDHLSFLIEGSASVERKRPGGRMEILATLHAPTVIGTTTFFVPNPPTFTVRANSEVCLLTLYHDKHERLRLENPAAGEALAVASLRVLSERFDQLDRMFSDYMNHHPDDHDKVTEWAGFRARLFEEASD